MGKSHIKMSFVLDIHCTVGLMALEDLHKKVIKSSKSRQDVTEWVLNMTDKTQKGPVWNFFRKISITLPPPPPPPSWKVFLVCTPSLWKSNTAPYFSIKTFAFASPSPLEFPRTFYWRGWGEGYLLELHILDCQFKRSCPLFLSFPNKFDKNKKINGVFNFLEALKSL